MKSGAGAGAGKGASLDLSTWFTEANVVPTYTLSSAASWITLATDFGAVCF